MISQLTIVLFSVTCLLAPSQVVCAEVCSYKTHLWSSQVNLCTSDLLKGDFNGDHREDIMCNDGSADAIYLAGESGVYHMPSSPVPTTFCVGGTKYVGDFNKDHRADILCLESNFEVNIIYLKSNMEFNSVSHHITYDPLCVGSRRGFFVADMDGDGASDLLCWDTNSILTIHYMRPPPYGRSKRHIVTSPGYMPKVVISQPVCSDAGDTLHVGHFDNNPRADVLCFNSAAGSFALHKTNVFGTIDNPLTPVAETPGFCTGTGTFMIGDVNGDHRTDFICHDAGVITHRFAAEAGLPSTDSGETLTWPCTTLATQPMDINGDGRVEVYCMDPSGAGLDAVVYAECRL